MSADAANPNAPYPRQPTTLIGAGFEWVKGQPFNNVLTAALLTALIAGIYGLYVSFNQAVTVHIPAHLRAIQDGYEKTEQSHDASIKVIVETLKEDRETDRKHQKEMLDLIIKSKVSVRSEDSQ